MNKIQFLYERLRMLDYGMIDLLIINSDLGFPTHVELDDKLLSQLIENIDRSIQMIKQIKSTIKKD